MEMSNLHKENSDKCINCLICIHVCPIIKGDFIPLNAYPEILINIEREIREYPNLMSFVYQCTLCKQCTVVCPRNLDIPKVTLLIRKIKKNSGIRHAPKNS